MATSIRFALTAELGNQGTIEFFYSSAMGEEIVHMQQVRSGQLDVDPIGSDAVQLDWKWAVFNIAFRFGSREDPAMVLEGNKAVTLRNLSKRTRV